MDKDDEHIMMVRMSEDLHRPLRVEAAKLGRSISEIVRQLIRGWLRGEIPTPPEETGKDAP